MRLTIAAVLIATVGLAHSVLGERYILIRLFRRELPHLFGSDVFTKRTLRFAWHLTTVAWWGFAALLMTRMESSQTSLRIVALTAGVSGGIALVASRGRHLSWIAFFVVAVLVWWAA
ncbi:MAG: hypothetical protein AAF170_11970 [Bacteroidota bacterium]